MASGACTPTLPSLLNMYTPISRGDTVTTNGASLLPTNKGPTRTSWADPLKKLSYGHPYERVCCREKLSDEEEQDLEQQQHTDWAEACCTPEPSDAPQQPSYPKRKAMRRDSGRDSMRGDLILSPLTTNTRTPSQPSGQPSHPTRTNTSTRRTRTSIRLVIDR